MLTLQRRPKVIGVKEAREFRVQVDNMHIALTTVANNSLGEIARLIRLDINTQSPVDFQSQPVAPLVIPK
jgi:hypothetical protein